MRKEVMVMTFGFIGLLFIGFMIWLGGKFVGSMVETAKKRSGPAGKTFTYVCLVLLGLSFVLAMISSM